MLKTKIHRFEFNTNNPEGKAAWLEFKACRLAVSRIHGPILSDNYFWLKNHDGAEIELDSSWLTDNQWNATFPDGKRHRVFDFALTADGKGNNGPEYRPMGIKSGHWLEQTAEMKAIRREYKKCGYCGALHHAANGSVFCDKCLTSPYLKKDDLNLLRLKYIDETSAKSPELSEAESAYLVPLWKAAQMKGTIAKAEKKRAEILEKRDKAIANANREFDGFTWLLNRGFNTDDVIYYPHSEKFCFGWRSEGVDSEMKSEILGFISEFPFAYEIKVKGSKKKLEGY